MSRLTYKLDEPIETKYLHYDYMKIADYDIDKGNSRRITNDRIYNKLGELEDIEEELGIDLITLFTAKKEGIYYKAINHTIYYISKNCLCLEFNYEWELWVENHSILEGLLIHLKDYKKTWALCKEDLKSE